MEACRKWRTDLLLQVWKRTGIADVRRRWRAREQPEGRQGVTGCRRRARRVPEGGGATAAAAEWCVCAGACINVNTEHTVSYTRTPMLAPTGYTRRQQRQKPRHSQSRLLTTREWNRTFRKNNFSFIYLFSFFWPFVSDLSRPRLRGISPAEPIKSRHSRCRVSGGRSPWPRWPRAAPHGPSSAVPPLRIPGKARKSPSSCGRAPEWPCRQTRSPTPTPRSAGRWGPGCSPCPTATCPLCRTASRPPKETRPTKTTKWWWVTCRLQRTTRFVCRARTARNCRLTAWTRLRREWDNEKGNALVVFSTF